MKGKRSLILRLRYAVARAALAIFCGPAASAAPVEAATGMCFEHIGPQDKPMPGFCVSGPDEAQMLQRLRARMAL